MDPSTSLSFLLGDLRITESKISVDTWVNLILELIDRMKGRVKYLDYFLTLSDHLNDGNNSVNGYCHTTDLAVIRMCEGVHGKTRFIHLHKSVVEGYGGDSLCVQEEILLLDQKGDLFSFVGFYKKSGKKDGVTPLHAKDGYVVTFDVSDLITMFESDRQAPMRVLTTFHNAVESAVTRTSHRLEQQRGDLEQVRATLLRIEEPRS